MFGYASTPDRFPGSLGASRPPRPLEDLAFTTCHLIHCSARRGDNDGGYAVQDYRACARPRHVDTSATRDHVAANRYQPGMDLCSTTGPRACLGGPPAPPADPSYRDYFTCFPTVGARAYERSLPEVSRSRAATSPSTPTRLVWTTFNESVDLDWANPAVLCEFADSSCARTRRRGAALDAIRSCGSGWEACQNHRVHAITQRLHTVARCAPASRQAGRSWGRGTSCSTSAPAPRRQGE